MKQPRAKEHLQRLRWGKKVQLVWGQGDEAKSIKGIRGQERTEVPPTGTCILRYSRIFIYSFNKYLLITYYTVDTRDTELKGT